MDRMCGTHFGYTSDFLCWTLAVKENHFCTHVIFMIEIDWCLLILARILSSLSEQFVSWGTIDLWKWIIFEIFSLIKGRMSATDIEFIMNVSIAYN